MEISRFHVLNFGLAMAITWGLWMLILGLGAWLTGWGTAAVTSLSAIYPGFAPTPVGIFIGTVLGAVCAFICGVVFSWIYNRLLGLQAS